jgi:hypothetical protein
VSRWALPASAAVCVAAAFLWAHPAPTGGPFLRDFEAYWSAGEAWNLHADPYGRSVWPIERNIAGVDATRDEVLPFVGPPAALPFFGMLARLPYAAAALIWSAVLAGALLLLVGASLRASKKPSELAAVSAALTLALAWRPLTSDLALGQLALPAFACATSAVVAAPYALGRATLAAFFALAQPNVALGLAFVLDRTRIALALILGACLSYAIGAIAAGAAWPLQYARLLASHLAAERFDAVQLTPVSIAFGFGAASTLATCVGLACALLAPAGAILLARRVREPLARFAGVCALVPFVAGFVHEQDLVVAYAAAVWCARRTAGSARAIALAATLLVSVDWFGIAQRTTGVAQNALLAAAALAAFIALGDAVEPRRLAATALFAAVALTSLSWFALGHPAPLWPNALGAFHAPGTASIAEVWAAEQRAAGLETPVAAWAFLRALPLAGCAMLAYAVGISAPKYPRPSCYRTA